MMKTTKMIVPDFTKPKRDLPAGTIVRITNSDKKIWEGQVSRNPIVTDTCIITLVDTVCLNNNFQGHYRDFPERDIENLEIVEEVNKIPKAAPKKERICGTYEVLTLDQFHKTLHGIEKLKKIGIVLLGSNYGRHMDVCYVVLNIKKALIVVNIKDLESELIHQNKTKANKSNLLQQNHYYSQLWKAMNDSIFSNPRLIKIVYNGLSTSDYLFHNHSITMKNVFDIQVGHLAIMKRALKEVDIFAQKYKGETRRKYMTLAQTLKYHMPQKVLQEEIDILEKVDKEDWYSCSPFSQKDPEKIYKKYAALQVKYLLKLYKIMVLPIFNVCAEFSQLTISLPMAMSMDKSRIYTTCQNTKIPLEIQEYASELNFDLK